MYTLCYYAAIMLPFKVYYAATNLYCYYSAIICNAISSYYSAIKSILCFYYAAINL